MFLFHTKKSINIDAVYIDDITNSFIKIIFYYNQKLYYAYTTIRNVPIITESIINYITECISEKKIMKAKIHPSTIHNQLIHPKLIFENTYPKKEIKTYEIEMFCPNTNKCFMNYVNESPQVPPPVILQPVDTRLFYNSDSDSDFSYEFID